MKTTPEERKRILAAMNAGWGSNDIWRDFQFRLLADLDKLLGVVRIYRHCRHGQRACFCTKEAQKALEKSGKKRKNN